MAPTDITEVLIGLRAGDRAGFDALLTLTYAELRRLARSHLRRERADHTLHATELVHEVWFKLAQHGGQTFVNRAHFFGAASRAMRRILVDHARRRAAHKRQGGERVTLTVLEGVGRAVSLHDILAVDAALDALAALNERLARVVECRVFAGFTIDETADALGVSRTTVSEDWRFARAWLHQTLAAVPDPRARAAPSTRRSDRAARGTVRPGPVCPSADRAPSARASFPAGSGGACRRTPG
jgi:RNA polymerase sigma factor (TIGR02999 family)